jgi:hypothetical protein
MPEVAIYPHLLPFPIHWEVPVEQESTPLGSALVLEWFFS